MDDEDLRHGLRCRFLRDEVVALEPGGKIIRTLVRTDGLKHRNLTCAFVVHRDPQSEAQFEAQPESGGVVYHGTLVARCFGVCCQCSLKLRLQLRLLIGSKEVHSLPWQEGVEVRDDSPAVRYSRLLRLTDFEMAAAEGACPEDKPTLVEIRLLLEVTAASPGFLVAPRVPTFAWTSLCDEEKEMVQVDCSDGSLCVERALLMRESARWKSQLSEASTQAPIDCSEFCLAEMKVFLFYLQTQLFYDLARFDTFNGMVRIAVRYSVSSVVRRCAEFVNECVLLAEAGERSSEAIGNSAAATSTTAASEQAPVSSKVRWTSEDLVAIWCTTVNCLGEEALGRALMRLICQSSYSEINRLEAFQQLDAATRSTFYHQFLVCREGAAAAGAPSAAAGGARTS